MSKEIKAYSAAEIVCLMKELGQPSFRAKQLVNWLYLQGVQSYDEMTNLPADLRSSLSSRHPLHPSKVVKKQVAQDGVQKYVIQFHDGAQTETVAIPSRTSLKSESKDRLTICISTQVGCGMGCQFCATGKEGFTRNLLPGEIVDQILLAQANMQQRVSNVVVMGQGEPFLNYDAVLASLQFINSPKGLAIGARRITISTCGIISGIEKFSQEPEQFNLALSLHSALQATRDQLMPQLSNTSILQTKQALMSYVEKTNRRVTLEYCMINQVNDTKADLTALLDFCKGLLCHVNLLPINQVDGNAFQRSADSKFTHWQEALTSFGIPTTVRNSRGADIAGACGQLKTVR